MVIIIVTVMQQTAENSTSQIGVVVSMYSANSFHYCITYCRSHAVLILLDTFFKTMGRYLILE